MGKSFKESLGFDSLISGNEQQPKKQGRPVGSGKEENKNKINKTWQVDSEVVNKIKLIASKETYRRTVESGAPVRVPDQGIVEEALKEYITKYEKKHGSL